MLKFDVYTTAKTKHLTSLIPREWFRNVHYRKSRGKRGKRMSAFFMHGESENNCKILQKLLTNLFK